MDCFGGDAGCWVVVLSLPFTCERGGVSCHEVFKALCCVPVAPLPPLLLLERGGICSCWS
jgi:hypothetical protein